MAAASCRRARRRRGGEVEGAQHRGSKQCRGGGGWRRVEDEGQADRWRPCSVGHGLPRRCPVHLFQGQRRPDVTQRWWCSTPTAALLLLSAVHVAAALLDAGRSRRSPAAGGGLCGVAEQ